ncbi:hypothetical protein [Ciceribacter ferrooxidans]|uniref:Uncharacterized protein n=1 Tax=Ciceribacter ferrooxidans TaxID=2509717 RepID=A0A4Q2TA00_9HYPH|nr:hypothetical protein [Ciceribacter ferrooxidans]RYC13954.1 hypothetical protein EUU22_10520 [Ciceribacter ferrooxidans]
MQSTTSKVSASNPQTEQGLTAELVLRMQTVLRERIDRMREGLRMTEKAVSELQVAEKRIVTLEAELQEVRKSSKEQEIRARKLDAENTVLRKRIADLEETEDRALRLQLLHQTAVIEVGRIVKALLPMISGRPWKKNMPLNDKAKLLIANEIVDPVWYLERHPDVAAAGMEAAVHYVLHGASEGRAPKPSLDEGKPLR